MRLVPCDLYSGQHPPNQRKRSDGRKQNRIRNYSVDRLHHRRKAHLLDGGTRYGVGASGGADDDDDEFSI